MSFQKLKTNTYCTVQKHYSGIKNIVGEITFIEKLAEKLNYQLVSAHYAVEKNQ